MLAGFAAGATPASAQIVVADKGDQKLSIAGYVQYDNDSDSVGVNTRLRWTFTPVGDLFVVYNHNVRELPDRWQLDSNQLLVKLQYTLRR